MNIKVLKKPMNYRDCPIVVRQSGESFEYLTVINNEIYSSFIVARKKFLQRLLLQPYTAKQLQNITNYVIAMAQTTIDAVLTGEKPKTETEKSSTGGIPTPAGLLV